MVRVDLAPMRAISVLSLFSLRKWEGNQDLISCRQAQREEGGMVDGGLEETWRQVGRGGWSVKWCQRLLSDRGG